MIVEDLASANIPSLKTHLHQRTAFQAMFAYKLALHELGTSEVNGLPAAIANAVADAIGRQDVTIPLTPSRVWTLIHGEDGDAPAAT